jgi:hypothetical protein
MAKFKVGGAINLITVIFAPKFKTNELSNLHVWSTILF